VNSRNGILGVECKKDKVYLALAQDGQLQGSVSESRG
jgi:hypothetical protein